MILAPAQRVDFAASPEGAWQLLLPVGVKHHAQFGRVDLNRAALQTMVKNFKAEGARRAVNYFHRGASSIQAPIDQKIAAGWISECDFREEPTPGLYVFVKYTDKARAHIVADELSYLSGEFSFVFPSKETGKDQGPTLTGAALLNDPFITQAAAIAASENTGMTPAILKSLGLSETATEAEVLAAIAKGSEATVRFTESGVKLAETEAARVALAEKSAKLEGEIETLKLAQRTAEVTAFCDAQVKAMKLTPAARPDIEKLGLERGVDAIRFVEKFAPAASVVEKGVTGASGAEDPKKAAALRFDTKRNELMSKGMSFMDAHNQTKLELREDFNLAYAAQ